MKTAFKGGAMISHIVALIALSALAPFSTAKFRGGDLESVPIERLIHNLQKLVEKEPKNVQVRYNLARVHAMAYALKSDTCQIDKWHAEWGPWFGNTPPAVPFKSVETKDTKKNEDAKQNLMKAISVYRDVLRIQSDRLDARLGLAWCIEQSGNKAEAIKAYRKVIEAGWEEERKLERGRLGGNYITTEAAGYLIPLLDREKDAQEIDTLQARATKLNRLRRPVTPIVVPLKDGLSWRDLEDRHASVAFDLDGTGLGKRWSWISKDAGWLVYDPHKAGKITSGLQLFGNVTFWCFFSNGYEALRCLDDNSDGVLTGRELDGLAIWHDAEGQGICRPENVHSLAYYGIVSISCDGQSDSTNRDRGVFSPRGVVFRNGTTRPTFDLILKQH
jgi:tetratricopeptide (TPR) repeat protein